MDQQLAKGSKYLTLEQILRRSGAGRAWPQAVEKMLKKIEDEKGKKEEAGDP
jgi:hypothetical protein